MKIKFLDKFVLSVHLVIEKKDITDVVKTINSSYSWFWITDISFEQDLWFMDFVIQKSKWTKIMHNLESKKYVLNRPYSYRDYAFFIERVES